MDTSGKLAADLTTRKSGHPNTAPLLWATLVTMVLWFVPYSNFLLYPLRIFVTFIHESGHAFAGLLTGVGVSSLHVQPEGSGVTWVGQSIVWDWVTISGGYVGAAIFGAILLQVSRMGSLNSRGKLALYGAATYVLLVTLLWAHNPLNNPGGSGPDFFTPIAGIVLAAGLFGLGWVANAKWAELAASFLAVQCGLNALGDLRTLLYLTTSGFGDNDAVFMARAYHIPSVFWALTWAVIAIVVLGGSLWAYLRGPR